jgi:hypothetical protein
VPVTNLNLGLICGLIYASLAAASMIPLEFPDKRAAIAAAFINRFAIGLLIPLVQLPMPGWAKGLAIGILLSIPDALITKAYAPIVGMGAIGGLVIGIIAGKFGA